MSYFEAGFVAAGYEGASETGIAFESIISFNYTTTTVINQKILNIVFDTQALQQKIISFNYRVGDALRQKPLSVHYDIIDGWKLKQVSFEYASPPPVFKNAILASHFNTGEPSEIPLRYVRKNTND